MDSQKTRYEMLGEWICLASNFARMSKNKMEDTAGHPIEMVEVAEEVEQVEGAILTLSRYPLRLPSQCRGLSLLISDRWLYRMHRRHPVDLFAENLRPDPRRWKHLQPGLEHQRQSRPR